MTEKQMLYRRNARHSIKLCKELELLVEYADYQEKMLNYESMQVATIRYNEIQLELDGIWDLQVDLFYEIQADYREYKKGALIDSFRATAKKNKYTADHKNY